MQCVFCTKMQSCWSVMDYYSHVGEMSISDKSWKYRTSDSYIDAESRSSSCKVLSCSMSSNRLFQRKSALLSK